MMVRMTAVVCVLVAAGTANAGPSQAPARERQRPAAAASGGLGQGWTALEAGRYSAAVSVADTVLQRRPHDHAAIVLKIQALSSAAEIGAALDTYAAWSSAHRQQDLHLLGITAEAVLRQIGANGPEMAQRVAALEALASRGDKSAAEALVQLRRSAGAEGEIALAKLGDEAAAQAIAKQIAAHSRDPDLIQRLGSVKAPAVEDQLIHLLGDADPGARAAAADALAKSGSESAAEALLRALKDPEASVRQSAAVALAAIGRPEGSDLVDRMLQTGVPDIVLSVAEALPSDPGRWQAVVLPILNAENPVDRLRAARLLGKNSPAEATRVLNEALSDPNIAVREEAARSISDVQGTDGSADWRRLLNDPSVWVRLEAARSIWQQATE